MSLFLYGNSPEMKETQGKFCGKNLSMEMSLFMYVNSAEMRETEGILWKKNVGMEMSLFMCGNVRKLRENHEKMAANTKFKQSLKYLGAYIFMA